MPKVSSAAQQPTPIAVIGVGCRFPGIHTPDELWDVVANGRTTVGEVPADRWRASDYYDPEPGTPGKMCCSVGGFVDGVEQFDAAFFGVSPKNAAQMDPQQRLLLEVGWEAIEHAGLRPTDLQGQSVGVFVGIQRNDYGRLMHGADSYNAYSVGGNQFSMTVSRLAHFYDLRGPCFALDAGCSSALVTLHLACQSLALGESDMALSGGVHLTLAPHDAVAASQAWMLSPSGKCRSFDADADGYVRSEGCGLLVLRRLDDALANGDPILGVVRGTAFFQEGRPGGFTSPWGPEVERTFRRALRTADVAPSSIAYIEGHGVGSPVADATEYQALARVLSESGDDRGPCYLGSIKPNIGHAETAAGAASLIKALEVLRRRRVPESLHFQKLDDDIDPALRVLTVPTKSAALQGPRPSRAAVNAFGLGGTNATVILEEPPQLPATSGRQGLHAFCVSARSSNALGKLAQRCAESLADSSDSSVAELCMASARRAVFNHRAVVLASTVDELRTGLQRLCDRDFEASARPRVLVGQVPPHPPRVAFAVGVADASDGASTVFEAFERADPGDDVAAIAEATIALYRELGVVPAAIVVNDEVVAAAALAGSEHDTPRVTIADTTTAALCVALGHQAELVVDAWPTTPLVDVVAAAPIIERADAGPIARLLINIATLWVSGVDIDFRRLWRSRLRHIPLPRYPFETQRHWVDELGPGSGAPPEFDVAAAVEPIRDDAAINDGDAQTGNDAQRQRALTAILQNCAATALGCTTEQVDIAAPLNDLGLESVDLLTLLERGRRAAGRADLDVSQFMDQPSIEETASRIIFGTADDHRSVDLSLEGTLDPTIDASSLPAAPRVPKAVFVTGATGFTGAFVLDALLRRTDAEIYCLVRALDALEGEKRLLDNLRKYGLEAPGFGGRVHCVIGDLGKPLLGLSYDRFDTLGTRVDAIYHVGALVNWAYPYELLKQVNVEGTAEVIRLAAHLKRKPLHHVSTIGVYPLGAPQLGRFYEADGLFIPERSVWLGTGYNQSKWAAEKMLYAAGARHGLSVAIYRPGFVTGHSQTGVVQLGRSDFIAAFIKGCIEFGQAPRWNVALDLMPVDYLANAIVELAKEPAPVGEPGSHNFVNPEPLAYGDVYEGLRQAGYALEPVDYPDWRERVLALGRAPSEHALFPFWPYYAALTKEKALAMEAHMGDGLPLDDRLTRPRLAAAGLKCPSVADLLPVYLRYFQSAGYLPSPAAPKDV
jgi:thioester reductase-like protein